MKTKYISYGLIRTHAIFHKNRTMSKNFTCKKLQVGEKGRASLFTIIGFKYHRSPVSVIHLF